MRGRARFKAGSSEDREVSAGSVIFVAAEVVHRFHDIKEELAVLVFFAPAESVACAVLTMDYQIDSYACRTWPAVREIYREGIATGNATFETELPDWESGTAPIASATGCLGTIIDDAPNSRLGKKGSTRMGRA